MTKLSYTIDVYAEGGSFGEPHLQSTVHEQVVAAAQALEQNLDVLHGLDNVKVHLYPTTPKNKERL